MKERILVQYSVLKNTDNTEKLFSLEEKFNKNFNNDSYNKWKNLYEKCLKEKSVKTIKSLEESLEKYGAMFANGYKAEALEESVEDEVVKQAKADAKQLKSNYRKQKNVAGAFNSLGYKYYSYNDVYEKNAGKYTIVFREIVPGKFEFSVFNDAERTSTPWDVVVLFKSNLKEANYGGAYDIDPEMFWTKDDLIEFSDAVCEKLADKFGYQYDIADVGAESNNDMYILIEDTTHDIEADVSFRIKMSRIRSPRDLMKYLDTVVSQFIKKFEEEYQYYDFDESLNEAIDVSKAMVAKEFNYEISYGGKSSKVSHAVIVIPDAVRFDNELSDLVIYAEDENGKVINFSSVDEANDWINKYKDTANFHWERDELHATPAEFVDESLKEQVNLPGYAVKYTTGYSGNGVNGSKTEWFRTEEERDRRVKELEDKNYIEIKTWKMDNFYHTLPKNESLNEDMSKPDFVVGFYAGPVDDYTLELINPKKIAQVDVSADELRAKYGKNVDKLLNDYTSQTVDKLKNGNSTLKAMILNFAEKKARETGELDNKFRNEERKFLDTGIYMDIKLEEINYPFEDGIKKLSKQLGKMLLPKRENLKEGFAEISDDFSFARSNWDKLNTGVSFDDALEEYNNQYGEEHFYAKPLYVKSAWDTMVSMFKEKEFWESLKEDVDDDIDLDIETDFGDGSVEEGDTFIEDGRTWSWIERIAGPIHLDFDNWAVWSARDWDYIQEKIRPILLNKEELTVETLTKIYDEAEVAYFVVDEDTGFIDWGPVESQTEAQDFLNGKVEDWENDEYDESLKESKQLKESYGLELEYDDIDGDGSSYTYEVDEDKVLDYLRDRDDYPEEIGNLPDDEFQAWFKTKEYDEWLEDNLYELFEKHYDDLLDYFKEDAQTEYFGKYGDEYSQDRETGSWYRRRW